jgi:nucleotide-binding universal stress UspA family protein
MVGSIICGVDESASARRAARVARDLSGKLGLGLMFVRVVDEGSADEKVNAIAARLERLTSAANDVDHGTRWLIEVGHPADRLVAAAAEAGASMIVVGSHGARSSLLGSVSADVSRRANCPVVVVPPGAEDRLSSERELPGGSNIRVERGVSNAGGIVRLRAASSVSGPAPGGRRWDMGRDREEAT